MNEFSEMRDDYADVFDAARDTSQWVRGKYFEQAMRAKGMVSIEPDLLAKFPTAAELNAALRSLVEASRHVH